MSFNKYGKAVGYQQKQKCTNCGRRDYIQYIGNQRLCKSCASGGAKKLHLNSQQLGAFKQKDERMPIELSKSTEGLYEGVIGMAIDENMKAYDAVLELMDSIDLTEELVEGKAEIQFTDRQKELIEFAGEKYSHSKLYQENAEVGSFYFEGKNATQIYVHMLNKIADAPTSLHAMCCPALCLPYMACALEKGVWSGNGYENC